MAVISKSNYHNIISNSKDIWDITKEYGNFQQEREENREQSRSNDTGTDIEIDIVRSQDQESSLNLQSENGNDAQRANDSDNNIRQTLCMISGASLTDKEKAQINRLDEILNKERKYLPSMRAVDKNKLNIEVQNVNKLPSRNPPILV
eukprot:gene10248-18939_t